ncbi:hypothetical protein PPACK8108_LOCUS15314 [Phakopsora pachyrhizi]|uniref:T-cell immunomodulatory protein TIP C2 domain-containing protein n=1 Tax=Phakopsora pachyrhizi TaxID=170000 RepID=A0AAV0B615_PHAPC|nr:hypothetical protein PPACK8108_LOCUS15314 [Phakopsora pachyrhizi]
MIDRMRHFFNLLKLLMILGSSIVKGSKNKFKAEGLFDLGKLGLDGVDGMIIALGDSNADQFRDIFTLSSDQRSVSLYLWDRDISEFVSVPKNPVISRTVEDFIITNVIATDVNYDGRLDLLVMGSVDPSSSLNSDLKMEVWYGIDGTSFRPGIKIPSSLSPHPLVFDAEGTMAVDLLGLPSSLPGILKVWRNQADATQDSVPFAIKDIPFHEPVDCKLPNPHSNAFIDLDGDCLADVFLTCEAENGRISFQIWSNTKSHGYSLARSGVLPLGTKQVSFTDIDRDGTIDMVFVACPSDDECSINVAYNQQIPLCTSGQRSNCRDPENLCTSDPNFQFSFDSTQPSFTSLPIKNLFPDFTIMTELSPTDFRGRSPISLQAGDYNMDGFPDLLVIIEPIGSRRGSHGAPRLLESVQCDEKHCTESQTSAKRRTFVPLSQGAEILNSINDAKGAFFMDIGEDGTLDLVVQRANKNGPTSRSLAFIKNNYFNDAFFLKAIMLNGACSSRCATRGNSTEHRPYGVNYAGASYKFTIQDTYGKRRAAAVGQIPFSTYASPMTPYCFFGLGRTNNYVENLFVGSTRRQSAHFINVEGLLPNSQLVIIPYQETGQNSPVSWKKELYLHPGDWIPWVTATLVAATLVLAIIVGVLHINEKREDERERRRKAHTINFDAL